jgi:hypothetical protein
MSTFAQVMDITSLLNVIELVHVFDPHTYSGTVEPAERYANIHIRKLARQIGHRLDQTHFVTPSIGKDIGFLSWIQEQLDRLVNRLLLGAQRDRLPNITPDSLRAQLLAVYEAGANPFAADMVLNDRRFYCIQKIEPPPVQFKTYSAFPCSSLWTPSYPLCRRRWDHPA